MTRYVVQGIEPEEDEIPWELASRIGEALREAGFENARVGIDVKRGSRRRR